MSSKAFTPSHVRRNNLIHTGCSSISQKVLMTGIKIREKYTYKTTQTPNTEDSREKGTLIVGAYV